MQLNFPPVKGTGTLKLDIAFWNTSNVGHQPQCMCFQTSFRICLCCKTYLQARSHRQGWSGQETSSKIYKTRLRLESQGVANDGFIVHRIFERKKKNQQLPTLYVTSTQQHDYFTNATVLQAVASHSTYIQPSVRWLSFVQLPSEKWNNENGIFSLR